MDQPSNEDKEPIRHLYRRYNELKETIAELEAEVCLLVVDVCRGARVHLGPLCCRLRGEAIQPEEAAAKLSPPRSPCQAVVQVAGVLSDLTGFCLCFCLRSTYRQLRREKRMLQLKLKTYEDEFLRLTGRKVCRVFWVLGKGPDG